MRSSIGIVQMELFSTVFSRKRILIVLISFFTDHCIKSISSLVNMELTKNKFYSNLSLFISTLLVFITPTILSLTVPYTEKIISFKKDLKSATRLILLLFQPKETS